MVKRNQGKRVTAFAWKKCRLMKLIMDGSISFLLSRMFVASTGVAQDAGRAARAYTCSTFDVAANDVITVRHERNATQVNWADPVRSQFSCNNCRWHARRIIQQ